MWKVNKTIRSTEYFCPRWRLPLLCQFVFEFECFILFQSKCKFRNVLWMIWMLHRFWGRTNFSLGLVTETWFFDYWPCRWIFCVCFTNVWKCVCYLYSTMTHFKNYKTADMRGAVLKIPFNARFLFSFENSPS